MLRSALVVIVLGVLGAVCADTPANCTYDDVQGSWTFHIGASGHDRTIKCTDEFQAEKDLKVTLKFPDVAVDENGNSGFWTMVYNQGFEVVVGGRKYFAFSAYTETPDKHVVSHCHKTLAGWSHDLQGKDWACYYGTKNSASSSSSSSQLTFSPSPGREATLFGQLKASVVLPSADYINRVQGSWLAVDYEEYDSLSVEQLLSRAGGSSQPLPVREPAPVTVEQWKEASKLPAQFDWRNVDGVNYVSPVRNQESCGSCYAFSSMGMNEARVRVMTNNTMQPVFSPQDIVECSEYSQGCAGGFPYLIGGKYAEDFGLVEEECNPYTGKDGKCHTDTSCPRHYASNYTYIGGYYGACNEALMKTNLVKYGPMSVSFEVYGDFMKYKGGVYQHTDAGYRFNPFHITNHAVLLVGYGTDPQSKLDYWLVKNSWGTNWGLDGYFMIRRGTNECNIETIAVQTFPRV